MVDVVGRHVADGLHDLYEDDAQNHGTVGAGGLGDIAIRYGYQRYQYDVMTVAVILCVILVQIVQTIGDVASNHIDHHER